MSKETRRVRVLRWILPLMLMAAAWWGAGYLKENRPRPEQGRPPEPPLVEVEAIRLQPQTYQVRLKSWGVVRPRTESLLVAQVAGQIVEVSERMREGAFFERGDLLLRIDDRDYRAQLEIARAQLAEAEVQLREERARSAQAERDWRRLGRGEPTDLVLRKPQLAAAEAALASARARVTSAELNLERTRVLAPYAGRVVEKSVDVGQVVGSGTSLGRIFAVDYVEVRLPLGNRQLGFVDLPEQYRGTTSPEHQPKVMLSAELGGVRHAWSGRLVRVESAIDTTTRELFVVAQVDDPYRRDPQGRPPLKIGQFVEAEIEGHRLQDVFVLPRAAVGLDNRVFVIEEGMLVARTIRPLWQDEQAVVIRGQLEAGTQLVVTPLSPTAEGSRARVRGEQQPAGEPRA